MVGPADCPLYHTYIQSTGNLFLLCWFHNVPADLLDSVKRVDRGLVPTPSVAHTPVVNTDELTQPNTDKGAVK